MALVEHHTDSSMLIEPSTNDHGVTLRGGRPYYGALSSPLYYPEGSASGVFVTLNHAPVRAYMFSVPNLSFLVRSRDLLTLTLMIMFKLAPECIRTRFSSQCGAQLPCTQLIPMLKQGIIEFCFNISC